MKFGNIDKNRTHGSRRTKYRQSKTNNLDFIVDKQYDVGYARNGLRSTSAGTYSHDMTNSDRKELGYDIELKKNNLHFNGNLNYGFCYLHDKSRWNKSKTKSKNKRNRKLSKFKF